MSCGHTKFEGSPPCPCDWQKTTDVGIDVSGDATVSLVDYGVLKERARIIGLLKSSLEGQNEHGITMFGGRMHWTAVLNHTVADFIELIEGETK
jgi:hypothetical protein